MLQKWNQMIYKHACRTKCQALLGATGSRNISSLFSSDNHQDAKDYLKAVYDLQTAMHYFITHHSTSDKLVLVQTLMQTAMKGLEREFYHMLKINGEYLDHESVSVSSSRASRASFSDLEDYEVSETESRISDDAIFEMERVSTAAMADLKAIADCMISAGYRKECWGRDEREGYFGLKGFFMANVDRSLFGGLR
ncbi:hypothetical protein KPL71_022806 [Citrus sinensis]|uniref:Uncharacterized protein n=1 Tax=Citrus sinensis TaxID=2711 RepID=A0ACB8IEQ5_CITSI|nr:hypothetical protein KPL71_022806 [Citrus sinensis]